MNSNLTADDHAFIQAQMPQLHTDTPQQQTRRICAIGKELSSTAAKHEWLRHAATLFPGYD